MPPLSAAVEVAAYRIVLEAFTNVVQHSQARSCQIDIRLDDDWLSLQVSDDGHGLSPDARSGVGFASMRERANELGGECSIETNPDGGLRCRPGCPLQRNK
jgi:signal transduction histidine kinase